MESFQGLRVFSLGDLDRSGAQAERERGRSVVHPSATQWNEISKTEKLLNMWVGICQPDVRSVAEGLTVTPRPDQ